MNQMKINQFQNFQINQPQFIKGGGIWSGNLGIDNKDPKAEEKKP